MTSENRYQVKIPWDSELAFLEEVRKAKEKAREAEKNKRENKKERKAFADLRVYAGVIFVSMCVCLVAIVCKVSGRK
jgi:hypothetical protein